MRTTETHIYFYSPREIYSNFHKCYFIDPRLKREFYASEIHFMYMKAEFFGDNRIATTLLNTQDPAAAKAFGRQVSNYDDAAWNLVRYGFMVYSNYLKFSQNPHFQRELLDTGNKILVEASPTDNVWGSGLSEDDDLILEEANWKGLNLLGKALMELRDTFRNQKLNK